MDEGKDHGSDGKWYAPGRSASLPEEHQAFESSWTTDGLWASLWLETASSPGWCSFALAVQKVREEGLCPCLCQHLLSPFCSLEYFPSKANLFSPGKKKSISSLYFCSVTDTVHKYHSLNGWLLCDADPPPGAPCCHQKQRQQTCTEFCHWVQEG